MIVVTGPKISSQEILASRLASKHRWLVEPPLRPFAVGQLLPAGEQLAFAFSDLDVARDRFPLRLGHARAHVDAFRQPVADAQGLRAGDELVLERLQDVFVDEQPGRRRAALARRPERAPERAVDREVHVRVVEYQDRVLSAHLQVKALVLLRAFHADRLSDRGRAGEGDDPDVRMVHERIADLGAGPRDDVENPVGKAGLLEDLRELEHGGGRVRGRLDDDGVAADERRHGLPRRDRDRKVPRRDEPAHPDGLARRHRPFVLQLGRSRHAEQAPPFAGREKRHVDRLLDVAPRLREHLAHLAGHDPADLFLAALEHVARGVEVLGALRSGRQAPVAVRLLRGRDGGVHVFRVRASGTARSARRDRPGCGSRRSSRKRRRPGGPRSSFDFRRSTSVDRTAARARAASAALPPSRLRAGSRTCRRCPGSARPPR